MVKTWMQRPLPVIFLAGVLTAVTAGFSRMEASPDPTAAASPQTQANSVATGADDIGGVVTSTMGPEAGVWVIAETNDLPTKYRKIVVTDGQGRYLIPGLPKASYKVWVRGYGLVDGPTVSQVMPGQHLALTALIAPNARAAAEYYPANYWFSLLQVPPKSDFPMTVTSIPVTGSGRVAAGAEGAVPTPHVIHTQAEWVAAVKNCNGLCHQMGTKATREISPVLGAYDTTAEKWNQRIRMGQLGAGHLNSIDSLGHDRPLSLFADWTDRIARGEVPPSPPRPAGIERNIVVTLWDVGTPTTFMHDLYATDERDPTVNGYGPVWGNDFNNNAIMKLDPKLNTVESIPLPFRDPDELRKMTQSMERPSLYFGDELIWDERGGSHVKNVDRKGRVWIAYAWRSQQKPPAFCLEGADNKYTKYFPLNKLSQRQLGYYDPATKKFKQIDTCFNNRHAAFADDADQTMYWAGYGIMGWINPRILDEGGTDEQAQGWCPAYYDLNGNGKYDKGIDKTIPQQGYYVTYNPVDKSVWYAINETPGELVRVDLGSNPPETCRTEVYAPPYNSAKAPGKLGYYPRGIDSDSKGLIWTGLMGSGQLASFDRTKCPATTPANMEDLQRCVQGWTLYDLPGPQLKGITDGGTADFIYGNWVDRFNTLGLGKDVPMLTGTSSDAMLALMPDTKKWVVLRVPYPLGFNARNLAGRIDDPSAGWKGRGLWVGNEVRTPWHIEGGKGTYPQAAHFQLRPDPLAK